MNWNEKMKALAEQGYTQKQMDNINIERQKLEDPGFLKLQKIPGPLTLPEEDQKFMEREPEGKEKNECL